MLRNYFLINIVLVIMLGLVGYKFFGVVTYSMDMPSAASVDKAQKKEDADARVNVMAPDRDFFQIISKKDLFRPSRSAAAPVTAVNGNAGRAVYPKLFATIILDNNSSALMEDPGTNRTKMYRVNEMIAGFQISEITQDKVVLLSGNERIVVKLREDKGIADPAPAAVRNPQNIRNPQDVRNPRDVRNSIRRRPVPAVKSPEANSPAVNAQPDSSPDEGTADPNQQPEM